MQGITSTPDSSSLCSMVTMAPTDSMCPAPGNARRGVRGPYNASYTVTSFV
jgi:hypothetical protein